jgi:midasin
MSKSTFVQGPLGCGKTRLVEFIANQTSRQELVNFQRIDMNDQIDGKTLLGNYSGHEVPGQFAWTNGIITKAVIKGDWLLIEDVDQAPPDVLSALDPLIRRRELHIASRGQVIKAHPGFHIFLTSRTPPTDNLSSGLKITTLSQWTDLEMSQLLMTLNPGLKEAIDKMITYFYSLEKSSDARRRPTTIRDLLKWCQRCGIYKQDLSAEDLILEGLDCFCWHLSKTEAVENATKLAHLFNVVTDRMYHLMEERSAVLINTKDSFKIGRVALQKRCKIEMSRPYYLTKSASRLLEFISMCVQMKEPALIVGETGVGKTSAIQYLSASTGHTLVVVNLNQQTESCDLIGGTKPVNGEYYLLPV